MTLTDKLLDIQEKQKTIDALLAEGINLQNVSKKAWYIEPLYNEKDCNIGFGIFPESPGKGIDGNSIPHYHEKNKEYLICIKGSVLLSINNEYVRKLKVGDCALLRPGEVHYSKPLEKDSKLVFICVPADTGYIEAFRKK